ncbi:MAG: AMP-binding protein [Deltaproteobacteria bacterium]|nr:AMP-binding protein [Deltaproteobacteria bacterium]
MAINKQEIFAKPAPPEVNTIPRLFWHRVNEWGDKTAMREKKYGLWKEISWKDYGKNARHFGLGLISLGLEKDDRVAIISENRPEWLFTDMGTVAVGAVTMGIYATDSPKQVKYLVEHSGSKFLIAEDEEQLDKVLEVREDLQFLEKIIVIDMEGLRDFSDPLVMSFDELLKLGKEQDQKDPSLFEKLLQGPEPDDLAILIYTSGTTGPPKGAMITHRNVIEGTQGFWDIDPGRMTDNMLTFLPLTHIAERGITTMGGLRSGHICNFAEEMDTVPRDIREVSPNLFFAVPRIWEKFYSTLMLTIKDSTPLEKLAFKLALAVGNKISDYKLSKTKPPFYLKILFKFFNLTVLQNVKKVTGLNNVRWCISGAAPISPDLLKFYHSIGIDMREVYGQTESTGAATMHIPGGTKFGTVGEPVPGCEIKIAEDGEILIKGSNVFKGYFNDPDKTRETIIDGWLHTGDVGSIDEDGHVIISDRKKDIIITAGGKNITPSEIENQLKFSPYVNDAVVIGDGRKYLTALIMIDDENVMEYAQENRIPFTTYANLTKAPEIIKLIHQEVEKVNKNFARVETVKKFSLIDIKLTEDDDEITPTMKLKRKFVSEKFKDAIEAMY